MGIRIGRTWQSSPPDRKECGPYLGCGPSPSAPAVHQPLGEEDLLRFHLGELERFFKMHLRRLRVVQGFLQIPHHRVVLLVGRQGPHSMRSGGGRLVNPWIPIRD